MHRGSDHLKPVRFLSFYGFVMRRPALTSRAVSSTMQDPLCVKRAWVRCVTTYASVSATWGCVEEPERFIEGSAVASSLHDAEPRGFQLLGLVRLLPMDFNVG